MKRGARKSVKRAMKGGCVELKRGPEKGEFLDKRARLNFSPFGAGAEATSTKRDVEKDRGKSKRK